MGPQFGVGTPLLGARCSYHKQRKHEFTKKHLPDYSPPKLVDSPPPLIRRKTTHEKNHCSDQGLIGRVDI